MDLEDRKKLCFLVEEATETGELTLDAKYLNEFKALAKKSPHNVESAFEFSLKQLQKRHAQVPAVIAAGIVTHPDKIP